MEKRPDSLYSGKIIEGQFELLNKIGEGAFGLIYKCRKLDTREICAIKFEVRDDQMTSMVLREIKVLLQMQSEQGFSEIIGYGVHFNYNFFVMQYLGSSLAKLLKFCGGSFSMDTVQHIFLQSLKLLQKLHMQGFIHRDLKPENFVIGNEDQNEIFLIDFGLAKYYRDQKGVHIPKVGNKGMIGTARYASINTHQGIEQSRRDDLEVFFDQIKKKGLGYVMVYMALGNLPWQFTGKMSHQQKFSKIESIKIAYQKDYKLCHNLPKQFQKYFQYVRRLEFAEDPDYIFLQELILGINPKYHQNFMTDWVYLRQNSPLKSSSYNRSERVKRQTDKQNIGNKAEQLKKMNRFQKQGSTPDKIKSINKMGIQKDQEVKNLRSSNSIGQYSMTSINSEQMSEVDTSRFINRVSFPSIGPIHEQSELEDGTVDILLKQYGSKIKEGENSFIKVQIDSQKSENIIPHIQSSILKTHSIMNKKSSDDSCIDYLNPQSIFDESLKKSGQDYHKLNPINIFTAKKSYKND